MARRSKAAADTPPVATPPPLALPAELTIYTVGELHPQWLAWLAQVAAAPHTDPAVDLQAAAVDQVDAAGLQLLVSLQRSLAALGRPCRVTDASASLRAACAGLGLERCIEEGVAP
jgi:ABC-type transporter Mla MlaB component